MAKGKDPTKAELHKYWSEAIRSLEKQDIETRRLEIKLKTVTSDLASQKRKTEHFENLLTGIRQAVIAIGAVTYPHESVEFVRSVADNEEPPQCDELLSALRHVFILTNDNLHVDRPDQWTHRAFR